MVRTPLRPSVLLLLSLPLWLTACAPMPPVPFDLTRQQEVSHGWFYPQERRLDVRIGDKLFSGYYIVASSTAYNPAPSLPFRRWGFPGDNVSVISSNTARASLAANDGERLSCELLFDGNRAAGECKSTQGQTYQLSTQAR